MAIPGGVEGRRWPGHPGHEPGPIDTGSATKRKDRSKQLAKLMQESQQQCQAGAERVQARSKGTRSILV